MMGTATTPAHPPASPNEAAHDHPEILPNDPVHDIDAKSTVTWVLGWTVFLFIGLYFLLVLFERILEQERSRKVDDLPNLELQETKQKELLYLTGKSEAGVQGKTIEQSMQELVERAKKK